MIDVQRCFQAEDLRGETNVPRLNFAGLSTLEKTAECEESGRHVLFETLVKAGYIAARMWLAPSRDITGKWQASCKES